MSKLNMEEVKEFNRSPEKVCLLDVRTQDEFQSGHIPGTTCIPLQDMEKRISEIPKDKPILLSCQSGNRSAKARQLLESLGYNQVFEVDGGFLAWSAAGFPVKRLSRTSLSIQRQVMLVAGSLVVLGTALSTWVSPWFLLIPGFVGAGLAFAGFSGFCGMAVFLERMPWNRVAQV